MKKLTITLAAAGLIALGACNNGQEASNDVNGSIGNGVGGNESGAAVTNAFGNAAAPADGAKPVDTGTAGTDSAAPAGDKPAADAAAGEAPAGDKPQG